MKRVFIIGVVVVILLTLVFWGHFKAQSEGYIPSLKITGDVATCLTIRSMAEAADTWEVKRIEHREQEIKALSLQDLIAAAGLVTKSNKILLVGRDGLVAEIDADTLAESYLTFSAANGWEAMNHKHPRSANIKEIKEIIVVARENHWDYGFNIIKKDKNVMNITPGQAYSGTAPFHPRLYHHFEGRSAIKHDDRVYETGIFTLKRVFELGDLVEFCYSDRNLIMGQRGGYGLLEKGGLFVLKGNHINYISAGGKQEIEKVRGVLLNAPDGSIMDHYHDVLYYIQDRNERVLTFLLDGFGWHQYEYAIEKGYAPFLASLEKASKVTALYPPITNVGLAAMITGKPPEYSGVYWRQRDLIIPSLFEVLTEQGKEAVLIGGSIKVLNGGIEWVLNIDKNESGTVDDEIFASALHHLEQKPDFIMVHFHSIDDTGESYGDLSAETMLAIKTVDGYMADLAARWPGRVIITSDHGMHSTPDGGQHGWFRFEDLLVPYLIIGHPDD